MPKRDTLCALSIPNEPFIAEEIDSRNNAFLSFRRHGEMRAANREMGHGLPFRLRVPPCFRLTSSFPPRPFSMSLATPISSTPEFSIYDHTYLFPLPVSQRGTNDSADNTLAKFIRLVLVPRFIVPLFWNKLLSRVEKCESFRHPNCGKFILLCKANSQKTKLEPGNRNETGKCHAAGFTSELFFAR